MQSLTKLAAILVSMIAFFVVLTHKLVSRPGGDDPVHEKHTLNDWSSRVENTSTSALIIKDRDGKPPTSSFNKENNGEQERITIPPMKSSSRGDSITKKKKSILISGATIPNQNIFFKKDGDYGRAGIHSGYSSSNGSSGKRGDAHPPKGNGEDGEEPDANASANIASAASSTSGKEPRMKSSAESNVLRKVKFNAKIDKHHGQGHDHEAKTVKGIHITEYHPYETPRKGSDIYSPEHRQELLLSPNQSRVLVPELQLARKFKVYFCKRPLRAGVRFYFLIQEGLLLHPGVELVEEDQINEADFLIYLPASAPWHLTECTSPAYASRLIVLDEFDGHFPLFTPTLPDAQLTDLYGPQHIWYFMYFKRSFVKRRDGYFLKYPHLVVPDVYPITYAISEAYTPYTFNFKREIDIMCSLRGNKKMITRLRVQTWVAEYGEARKIQNIISGQVNQETRTTVSTHYFEHMFNSRIIVTVNPAGWEGDFRLWESMCTGALVFVDRLFVPHPDELKHGEHIVYFDNANKTDLWAKLDYFRANPEEARRVAIQGYLYAMTHHRTVNTVDYVIRSAHAKLEMLQLAKEGEHAITPTPYVDTAQALNQNLRERAAEFQAIGDQSRAILKVIDAERVEEEKKAKKVWGGAPEIDMTSGGSISFKGGFA